MVKVVNEMNEYSGPSWSICARLVAQESLLPSFETKPALNLTRSGQRWTCKSVEQDHSVLLVEHDKQEAKLKFTDFNHVFREDVREEAVFQRLEDPLLQEVWAGRSCGFMVCGYVESTKSMLARSLNALFFKVNEACEFSSSVLRFKVALQIVDVYSGGTIVDGLDKNRRLHIGPNGECIPEATLMYVDSAGEALARLSEVDKNDVRPSSSSSSSSSRLPPRHAQGKSKHRIVTLRLERWVRSRSRGLLTPTKRRNGSTDEEEKRQPAWAITTSELKFVHICVNENGKRSNPGMETFGAHGTAHTHHLDKDIAQTLTSFCRCLREPGVGYRDSRLTHLLKSIMTEGSRCTLLARVVANTNKYPYSVGPLRFVERVQRAIRTRAALNADTPRPTTPMREQPRTAIPSPTPKRKVDPSSTIPSQSLRVMDWLEDFRQEIDDEDKLVLDEGEENNSSYGEAILQEVDRLSSKKQEEDILSADLENGLKASREALREQLTRFQVGKDLLKTKHVEHLESQRASLNERRMEESETLIKRLETERQEALEKGRGLMQQLWQVEAEKADALQNSRIMKEKIDFFESEKEANEQMMKEMKERFVQDMERLKQQHARELSNQSKQIENRLAKERNELLGRVEFLGEEKLQLLEEERVKWNQKFSSQDELHRKQVEELRQQAKERENSLKDKVQTLQYEKRQQLDELTKLKLDKERIIRELQERIESLTSDMALHEERHKLEQQDERTRLEEEFMDQLSQLQYQLELAQKVAREKELLHQQEMDYANKKHAELNQKLLQTMREMQAERHELEQSKLNLKRQTNQLLATTSSRLEQDEQRNAYMDNGHEGDEGVDDFLSIAEQQQELHEQYMIKAEEAQALKTIAEELSQAHAAVCGDLEQAHEQIKHLMDQLEDLEQDLEQERVQKEKTRMELAKLHEVRQHERTQLENAERSVQLAYETQKQLQENCRELKQQLILQQQATAATTTTKKKSVVHHHEEVLAEADNNLEEEDDHNRLIQSFTRKAIGEASNKRQKEVDLIKSVAKVAADEALYQISSTMKRPSSANNHRRSVNRGYSQRTRRPPRFDGMFDEDLSMYNEEQDSEEDDLESLIYQRKRPIDIAQHSINKSLVKSLRERDMQVAMLQRQLDSVMGSGASKRL